MSIVAVVRGRFASRFAVAVFTLALAASVVPPAGWASASAPQIARSPEAAHRQVRTIARRTRHAAAAPVANAFAPGRAGMVIEVDAPSGANGAANLDPIQAIPADLDSALNHSTEGLQVLTLPDGSRRVNLEGRFRSYSVVTIGADGSLKMACAANPSSALGVAGPAAISIPTARAPRPMVGPREE